MGKKIFTITLFLIFVISLFYRVYGLPKQGPFWTDEFSSAHQARYIIKYGLGVFSFIGKPPYFEERNIITHFLIALFFKFFGQHEWSARLPIAIIGSLVPVSVFIFAKKFFNTKTAVISTIFTIFSYFEITWSRQARGYIIQQLLTLTTLYLYLDQLNLKKYSIKKIFFLISTLLIGMLTHPLFYLVIASLIIHFLIEKKQLKILFVFVICGLGFLFVEKMIKANNLWYYHSFLWREYGLITFLALVGIVVAWKRFPRVTLLSIIFVLTHLFFICFLFQPYVTRYVLPIFPLFFIFAGFVLTQIPLPFENIMPIALAFIIVVSGNKFVVKPKSYYSVNHDFREIANIDYDQIYATMLKKGDFTHHQTAIIEPWLDRMHWYMGQNFFDAFELKWKNPIVINGIQSSNSNYFLNSRAEKMIVRYPKIGLVNDVADLQVAMKRYPKGFIFIDDATLPKDVLEFVTTRLKKELYLDHYPLDDNPYSIWPATLYSWGM